MRRDLLLTAAGILGVGLVLSFLGLRGRREPGLERAPPSGAPELGRRQTRGLDPTDPVDPAEGGTLRREAQDSAPRNARLIVRTLDASGRPIAGATVLLGTEALGTTDAAGEVAIWRSRAERAFQIGAVAKGMGPVHRTLYRPIPERIDLLLSEACGISGTLVAKGLRSPPAGALVAAWPRGFEASQAGIERILASAGGESWDGLRVVAADASGGFQFDGLAADLPYVLTAGAPGWAAEEQVAVERACDGRSTTLVLRPLYGALLDLADAAGEPLAVSPEILTRMTWGLGEEGNGKVLSGEAPEAALAGLSFTDARAKGLRPFLALAEHELPRIGPMSLTCDAFGYGQGRLKIWLERASASLPVHPARLAETAPAWGTLTVGIEGLPAACIPAGASAGSPLRLWLQPDGGDERIAHLELRNGATSLRVPQGSYSVRLTLSDELYQVPKQRVEVGASTEVAFSLADLGCIEIQPDFGVRDSGHAGLGVRVQVEGGPEYSGVNLYVDEPPYLLSGFPPGRYQLQVVFPDPKAFQPAAVEVQGGSRSELRPPRAD